MADKHNENMMTHYWKATADDCDRARYRHPIAPTVGDNVVIRGRYYMVTLAESVGPGIGFVYDIVLTPANGAAAVWHWTIPSTPRHHKDAYIARCPWVSTPDEIKYAPIRATLVLTRED